MNILTLEVDERKETGKGASQRLRRSGSVPAVMYAEGKPARLLALGEQHYRRVARNCRPTQLFRLKSAAGNIDGLTVLVKDTQIEPVKDRVVHVDFLEVTEGHRITIAVGLEVIGESPVVKAGDAILNQVTHEIEIECLPSEIPDVFRVDVSLLLEGMSIHAGDIILPPNVELISDPELTIVSAIAKREEEEVKPAVAPEAVAEVAAEAPAKEE